MKNPKPIFEVEKLRVEREAVILREVNWRVERGQHWVILGANGSGKTSLLSALTGEGLAELETKIETALLGDTLDETESALTINARQNATLQRAAQALHRALAALRYSLGLEIVSIELRDALHELAEVIGETDNEDILTRLFQNFCIGK